MVRFLPSLAVLALSASWGCSSTVSPRPAATGAAYVQSDADFSTTYGRLTSALRAADPVGIVAEVDHAASAAAAGLSLRPTRVVLFGNPRLGTPLMQINPQAGLDLPQKILVLEDADGETFLVYNTADYLAARHGVGAASTLPQIATALDGFARGAAGQAGRAGGASASVDRDQGVVSVASPDDVPTTYARLRAAVAGNPNLTIAAELDHQANAASVGLDLPPTRLIVFGNPALGTPLMQIDQVAGLDLPQKMLVYRGADGRTVVAYNDPAFLASRPGLGRPSQIGTIAGALAGLAEAAAGR